MKIVRKNTPNQYALAGPVEAIILHTTLGAYAGAVDWMMTSPEERKRKTGRATYSSAHAVFGRLKDEVTQLAPYNRGTWHAGALSSPSPRAKGILPKYPWGTLKNPNKHTIGLEFAAGYDVDRDGVLEGWEKLYTTAQIKNCVLFILDEIEPATGRTFGASRILTHRDVTSYKPELELQRAMVVAELNKERARREAAKNKPIPPSPPTQPVPPQKEELVLKHGDKLVVEVKGSNAIIKKA